MMIITNRLLLLVDFSECYQKFFFNFSFSNPLTIFLSSFASGELRRFRKLISKTFENQHYIKLCNCLFLKICYILRESNLHWERKFDHFTSWWVHYSLKLWTKWVCGIIGAIPVFFYWFPNLNEFCFDNLHLLARNLHI